MRKGMSQVMLTSLLTAAVTVAMAGVAMAVSGGGYQPSQQDCPASADAYNVDGTSPGCHNFKLNVENGRGKRYAEVGLDQLPKGSSTPGLFGVGMPGSSNFPHAGCVAVNTSGTKGGPGRGCGTNQGGTGFTAVFDTALRPNMIQRPTAISLHSTPRTRPATPSPPRRARPIRAGCSPRSRTAWSSTSGPTTTWMRGSTTASTGAR